MKRGNNLFVLSLGLFAAAFFALAGCSRSPTGFLSEQEETAFRRGKQSLREGRPDEALQAFMSVIEHRHDAPESHLEAGLLYLNRFNEPVLAIYHFNEYLRLKPNSEQAQRVRELMMTAKKEFARSLPASPFGNEVDKLDLKELLEKNRSETDALKSDLLKTREELERYKTLEQARLTLEKQPPIPMGNGGVTLPSNGPVESTKKKSDTTTKTQTSGPRHYAVQEGDTLSIISKKFYGTTSKWKMLAEANKSALPDPRRLKLGQTLVIP